jgi:hypothetical protein
MRGFRSWKGQGSGRRGEEGGEAQWESSRPPWSYPAQQAVEEHSRNACAAGVERQGPEQVLILRHKVVRDVRNLHVALCAGGRLAVMQPCMGEPPGPSTSSQPQLHQE